MQEESFSASPHWISPRKARSKESVLTLDGVENIPAELTLINKRYFSSSLLHLWYKINYKGWIKWNKITRHTKKFSKPACSKTPHSQQFLSIFVHNRNVLWVPSLFFYFKSYFYNQNCNFSMNKFLFLYKLKLLHKCQVRGFPVILLSIINSRLDKFQ